MGTFFLSMFDEFFVAYKETNTLAPDALMALDHFLSALNEFFNLCNELNQDMVMNNTKINWYSYTNMVASGNYIQAKSRYYNQPEFSNISIKMSEEELDDYNTDEETCFGKICIISIKL